MDIQKLKEIVSDKGLKFIYVIWLCLNFVDTNIEYANIIGCMWISHDLFIVNNKKLNEFLGRKINTMCSNFRTHAIIRDRTKVGKAKISNIFFGKNLTDIENWSIMSNENFTKSTTEKEAKEWKFVGPVKKSSIQVTVKAATKTKTGKNKRKSRQVNMTNSAPQKQITQNFNLNFNYALIQHPIQPINVQQQQQLIFNNQTQNLFSQCNASNNQFITNPTQSMATAFSNNQHAIQQPQQQQPIFSGQTWDFFSQLNASNNQFITNPTQSMATAFNNGQQAIQQPPPPPPPIFSDQTWNFFSQCNASNNQFITNPTQSMATALNNGQQASQQQPLQLNGSNALTSNQQSKNPNLIDSEFDDDLRMEMNDALPDDEDDAYSIIQQPSNDDNLDDDDDDDEIMRPY